MSATIVGFRTRFPEYSDINTYPDARIQMFLDDSALCIHSPVYGAMYDMAIYYLSAHELFMAIGTAKGAGSNVGPVSSKTAGSVSVSRAVASVDLTQGDSYYTLSQYGVKYLSIRDKVKIPGFLVLSVNRAVI